MAAKRVTGSAINWSAVAERCPEAQKATFAAFKVRSDNYLRRVLANPETPPKIDWSYYKSRIPVAGLVDSFQKSYDALTIPYPTGNVSSQIDAQEKEVKVEYAKFVAESKERIAQYQEQKKKFEAMIPYSEMTIEEYFEAHPEDALDPVNKPTFWPHTPEYQPGYVHPAGTLAEEDH